MHAVTFLSYVRMSIWCPKVWTSEHKSGPALAGPNVFVTSLLGQGPKVQIKKKLRKQ